MHWHTYDTALYPFREKVELYLGNRDLENIHNNHKFSGLLTDANGENSDQGQVLHRQFYEGMDADPSFKSIYDSLIKNVVSPTFDEPILFQKFPTFRIHQPENICVFDWHRDRDFNHSVKEVNIFMPITKAYDSNTIWAESIDGKGDFSPIEGKYGDVVMWDGPNLQHGNRLNTTGSTRVSFDFRVIRLSDYDESDVRTSITTSTTFVRGEYFDEKAV